MKIVELEPNDFDNYAKSHEYANPWQTSSFGKAAETLGYNVLYLGFEDAVIEVIPSTARSINFICTTWPSY